MASKKQARKLKERKRKLLKLAKSVTLTHVLKQAEAVVRLYKFVPLHLSKVRKDDVIEEPSRFDQLQIMDVFMYTSELSHTLTALKVSRRKAIVGIELSDTYDIVNSSLTCKDLQKVRIPKAQTVTAFTRK